MTILTVENISKHFGGLVAVNSLSLSVEDGNPAEELYRKSGFVPVGRVGNATTMLYTRRSD